MLYVAHLESPADMLPRSHCSSAPGGTLEESAAITSDTWRDFGRQSCRPQLVECGARERSKSSVYGSFSARMTTVHPIQGQRFAAHTGLAQSAWSATRATSGLFFEPRTDRVARHAEGARQATQRTALMIGA